MTILTPGFDYDSGGFPKEWLNILPVDTYSKVCLSTSRVATNTSSEPAAEPVTSQRAPKSAAAARESRKELDAQCGGSPRLLGRAFKQKT